MKKLITLLLLASSLSIHAQQYPAWADSIDNVSYWRGTTLVEHKSSTPSVNVEYVLYNDVIYVYEIRHERGRCYVERMVETHNIEWFQNKYPKVVIPKK